ncbi:DUF2231 domain-containing protein [Ectothiorhodospiraceae bacterium WFHF3C12]|nr:DUF2231 domain-containing protein [Ectothiorhodospiraceae bacterium WFHF3C12]
MPEIIPNWHPVLVHFTIGLLLTGTLFYLLALVLPTERLSLEAVLAARWVLIAGGAITVATLIAGWYAYNSVAHDDAAHAAMTGHRNWALVTAAIFAVLIVWEAMRARSGLKASGRVGAALLIAALLLVVTGYKGGEVVYRHGVGVMSLPATGDHGHAAGEHDHQTTDVHEKSTGAMGSTDDGGSVAPDEGDDAGTPHDHGDHEH